LRGYLYHCNSVIKKLKEVRFLTPKKKDKSEGKLRDEMLQELSVEDSESKRDMPVMTRLDKKLIELLDILVKLDIFNSRSEAVAAIVEKTLLTQLDKFELLKDQISKLEEIQDTAKDIALDVLKGK
jgi:Arc/MetJ-type ribon-helix-helix transcriptional regulator